MLLLANPTWLKRQAATAVPRASTDTGTGTVRQRVRLSGTRTAHILKYSCRYSSSHSYTANQNGLINAFDVALTVNRRGR